MDDCRESRSKDSFGTARVEVLQHREYYGSILCPGAPHRHKGSGGNNVVPGVRGQEGNFVISYMEGILSLLLGVVSVQVVSSVCIARNRYVLRHHDMLWARTVVVHPKKPKGRAGC